MDSSVRHTYQVRPGLKIPSPRGGEDSELSANGTTNQGEGRVAQNFKIHERVKVNLRRRCLESWESLLTSPLVLLLTVLGIFHLVSL
jgi:hypothetical protein